MNFVSSITLMFRDSFSSGFEHARNSFAGMKDAIGQINQNSGMNRMAADIAMMTSMTEPARRALSDMMDQPSKLAGTYESSLKNIQVLTGNSTAQMNSLNKELLDMGSRAVAGPGATAAAMNDIAGGIANADSHLGILSASIAMAEAGQGDLSVAAGGMVKIMNSYGFAAGTAAEATEHAAFVSDVFTQTVGMGVGSMNEFISAMSPISGIASSVGVGFDEIGAAVGYMSSTTDTASTAATKIQSAIIALLKPNKTLQEGLQSIGIASGSAMLKEYGLAESLQIVSNLYGGNQDAIAEAMGRQEAMNAVLSLSGKGYGEFASQFGKGIDGITAAAQKIQMESYESKVARAAAASDVFKTQVGTDINSIKGFFLDMGTGFMQNVALPIMNSPVGPAVSKIAAFAGMGAKGILDLGSGALTTAAQLAVLTAHVQNAGGIASLFKNTLSLLGTPLAIVGNLAKTGGGGIISFGKALLGGLPTLGAWAASMWTTASATIAATWPVLAIIGAVAALAAGAYLLIKNWDSVSAFFVNLWNTITGAFSVAITWIKAFFSSLGTSIVGFLSPLITTITGIFTPIIDWLAGAWTAITSAFTAAWGYVVSFFSWAWDSMVGVVVNVGNWFSEVWTVITGAFAAAWTWVTDFFVWIWEGLKNVVMGFVSWFQPVIDIIVAPFKWIANVIGTIVDTAGEWFGTATSAGNNAVAQMNTNLAKTTTATSAAAAPIAAKPIAAPAPVVAPKSPALAQPLTSTATMTPAVLPATAEGATLTTSTARMSGGPVSHSASQAFSDALGAAYPAIGGAALGEEITSAFQAALPRTTALESSTSRETREVGTSTQTVKIENLYVQADDCMSVFDFVRTLMLATSRPEEVSI